MKRHGLRVGLCCALLAFTAEGSSVARESPAPEVARGYRAAAQTIRHLRQTFAHYVEDNIAAQLDESVAAGSAEPPASASVLTAGFPFLTNALLATTVSASGDTVTLCFSAQVDTLAEYTGFVAALRDLGATFANSSCAAGNPASLPQSYPASPRGLIELTLPEFYSAEGAVPGYLTLPGLTGRLELRFAAPVGQETSAQSVTVKNQGLVPVRLSSSTAPDYYSVQHNCGVQVDPDASCVVQVRFSAASRQRLVGVVHLQFTGVDTYDPPDPDPGHVYIPVAGYGYWVPGS